MKKAMRIRDISVGTVFCFHAHDYVPYDRALFTRLDYNQSYGAYMCDCVDDEGPTCFLDGDEIVYVKG